MGLLRRLGLERRRSPVPSEEMAAWFEGKDFTKDWLGKKAEVWMQTLEPLRGRPIDILEVGSFEGRSSVFFLNYFPASQLTAVDNFNSGKNAKWQDVERRFDCNLSGYGERVTAMKDEAAVALARLGAAGRQFDLVYLDAGKQREWVFALSSLAWPLVRVGGYVIWDDLDWRPYLDSRKRPHDAIRLFASTFRSCLSVEYRGRQLIAQKRAEWPRHFVTKPRPQKVKKPAKPG